MGAFRALPAKFARIHPRYLTPTDSTIWMGGVSIVFCVGLTLVGANVLGHSISAVGLMIALLRDDRLRLRVVLPHPSVLPLRDNLREGPCPAFPQIRGPLQSGAIVGWSPPQRR